MGGKRGTVHENDKSKGTNHVQDEMEKPMHQDWMVGDRQGTIREAQRALEVGREGIQDTRKTRVVRLDAAAGGAESSAVRGCHG